MLMLYLLEICGWHPNIHSIKYVVSTYCVSASLLEIANIKYYLCFFTYSHSGARVLNVKLLEKYMNFYVYKGLFVFF